MLVISCIWTILFLLMVCGPMRSALLEKRQKELVKAFRGFQLDILRSHYPALRNMSDREIQDQYQVDRIFFRL